MEPEKIDPNSTLRHPVVALRAEGTSGFVRSLLQLLGSILVSWLALFGNFSIWWLIVSVPLGLFALVEVVGSLRYAYLVRQGRVDPTASTLE
jgi:hypothetical protein